MLRNEQGFGYPNIPLIEAIYGKFEREMSGNWPYEIFGGLGVDPYNGVCRQLYLLLEHHLTEAPRS